MKNRLSLLLSALGFWLVLLPLTLDYCCGSMYVSDFFSGVALLLLGWVGCVVQKKRVFIISAFVGIWLQLAPLFFWAKSSTMYLNDTLVGVLVIVLSAFLLRFYEEEKETRSTVPLGWSFNPSDWGPRLITTSLAMVCWFLARYLAFYQLGYIQHVEDPFFGDGTIKVITSSVSKLFPVSDAGLGAFVYTIEFILGWMGGKNRWKTMPWLSVFFGMLVVPAGMTSILLIISQPIFVGAWCGVCLAIAVCMLVMIMLTIPEVVASLQLLHRVRVRKEGFSRVFWKGYTAVDYTIPVIPIERTRFSELGLSFPINLLLSLLLGVWLMCAPSLLGIPHPAADLEYLVGPLVIAFTAVSFSEVTRNVRFVNAFLGLVLMIAPFWINAFSLSGICHNLILGAALVILSWRKGKIRERYGKL